MWNRVMLQINQSRNFQAERFHLRSFSLRYDNVDTSYGPIDCDIYRLRYSNEEATADSYFVFVGRYCNNQPNFSSF